jgi:phosphohistidine phosphatase
MKRLTILRHAKSDYLKEGQTDFDRGLNERGLRDLTYMPERMLQKTGKPDFILSSSAFRAKTTTAAFADFFKLTATLEENLYHAMPETHIAFLQKLPANKDHVLLVAHNPGLTMLVNRMAVDFNIDNLPTCSFVSIELDIEHWSDLEERAGKLVAYDFPKNA